MAVSRLLTFCFLTTILLPQVGFSGPKDSLEYKLAVINAGGYVSEDDITVKRFRYLLTSISSKTPNTKQQISDMTVKGWQLLQEDYGKRMKLIELMEAANKAIPENSRSLKYESVVSALIVMIGKEP